MSEPADLALGARAPYAPRVVRVHGQFLYEIYVASGHFDREERLPIDQRHLHVLTHDVERYWFLFTALHHPYQLTETRLSGARLTEYLDTILLGSPRDVETFLTGLDHGAANGALSNLLRIFVDADASRMRAGRWFNSIPDMKRRQSDC